MRIALTDCAKPYTGIGVYTKELIANLQQVSTDEIFIFNKKQMVEHQCFCALALNKLSMLAHEQISLPLWLKKESIDLIHQTKNYTVPLCFSGKRVVTIHDVIPHVFAEQYLPSMAAKKYYQFLMGITIRKSDRIITVSDFSKKEIIKYLGVEPKKIEVIHLAVCDRFKQINQEEATKNFLKKYGIDRPFILSAGGNEYRKNNERLITVFKENFAQTHMLVVLGQKWRNESFDNEKNDNIIFVGSLSEQELILLYNRAELFVFPSLYEGFGLPILEAMACGTPVATSNLSSLPEVAGGAAALFDPYDADDIKKTMLRVLESKELQAELIGRGLQRRQDFSWRKTAEKTAAVYEKTLKNL